MRFFDRLAGAVLAVGLVSPACSGDDTAASTGTTATTSATATGTTGAGGAGGGPVVDEVCASSPVAAAFPGTDDCPAPVPGVADTLDEALAAGGLDRCGVRLLPEDVALSGWPEPMLVDKRRLPDFTPLQRGPLRLPGYGRETAQWLDAALASERPVSETVAALSARRGTPITGACFDLTPYAAEPDDDAPLARAILLLDEHHGAPADEATVRAAVASIPPGIQTALAPIVGALDLAATEARSALGNAAPADLTYFARSYLLYVPSTNAFSTTATSIAKLDTVDLGRMAGAAAALAAAIERADLGALADATFAAAEIETPLGTIVVHDSSDDLYAKDGAASAALLLFDLGGDDTYQVPAGASDADHPVSIAIDVRGVDAYGYVEVPVALDAGLLPSDGKGRYSPPTPPAEGYGPFTRSNTPRQGAGTAGIGMLFDLGAEGDTYRSLAISQGFAAMGVGVLYDAGGDDDYASEVASQGTAIFGVAALIDQNGNDARKAFHISQGFGGAQGAAALVDGAGDDDYYCDPGNPADGGHPVYYSPQLPGTGQSSMSQGAAQGRRPQSADDAAYMAGGVGILRDKSGADHYTASVFAQGAGYWQGIGLLLEGGGDDEYNAYWYIQGSTAHFALSLFLEQGGNDRYNQLFTPAATSIGVGHDFSASLHIDEGGADQYRAPGLSLGSGNINGIGFLVNSGGDDVYVAAGDPTLGAGNYSSEAPFGEDRQDAPTIGVFVDVGGDDTYTVGGTDRALDDTTWSYEPQPYPAPDMVLTEHGCSADDAGGSVTLP
jgi:hypothetical protein